MYSDISTRMIVLLRDTVGSSFKLQNKGNVGRFSSKAECLTDYENSCNEQIYKFRRL